MEGWGFNPFSSFSSFLPPMPPSSSSSELSPLSDASEFSQGAPRPSAKSDFYDPYYLSRNPPREQEYHPQNVTISYQQPSGVKSVNRSSAIHAHSANQTNPYLHHEAHGVRIEDPSLRGMEPPPTHMRSARQKNRSVHARTHVQTTSLQQVSHSRPSSLVLSYLGDLLHIYSHTLVRLSCITHLHSSFNPNTEPPVPVESQYTQSASTASKRRASDATYPKVEDSDPPKPLYAKQKRYRAQKARLTQELRAELQDFGSLTKTREAKAPELMDAAAKTLRKNRAFYDDVRQIVAEGSGPVAEFLRDAIPAFRSGFDEDENIGSDEGPVASTSQIPRHQDDIEMISTDEQDADYVPPRRMKREPDAAD
ncbi:hypothetical protein SISSUDRAFT_240265 [Sistotremastrum suecicum HHB10207 ss-3]|uniref:Uncharacterized protein n=1 Tax=Sistotremastrum suecicum HHB10207 ss-3 TaxID=1314776 RepID=A0A166GJP2_9AGAM|nr:hypothetical protein SISSUDRAFT_240265 [Sistotremastrum suecicum HHB10207 ss-3]